MTSKETDIINFILKNIKDVKFVEISDDYNSDVRHIIIDHFELKINPKGLFKKGKIFDILRIKECYYSFGTETAYKINGVGVGSICYPAPFLHNNICLHDLNSQLDIIKKHTEEEKYKKDKLEYEQKKQIKEESELGNLYKYMFGKD